MSSYYRQQLENWLKTIDVKADRVLDVGGAQLPVKGRTKSWNVKEYRIFDLKKPHQKNAKVDVAIDLNKKLLLLRSDIHRYFDVIFCLEVFEYIWNPVQALENLYEMGNCTDCVGTKEGDTSIYYLSFPFIYPHHNPKGKDYLRYTRWGIEKLLKETGFEILEVQSRVMTPEGFKNWKDFLRNEKMHPVKDYPHNEIGYCVTAKKL